MGHPSDWDEVRAALPEYDTAAVAIQPAAAWETTVKQLADSISPDSIIVGYSMGARLALGVAFEVPQRCQGLMFVSGNPGLESEQVREQRWLSDQKVAERIETGELGTFLNDWYQASVFEGLADEIRLAEIARKLALYSNDWPSILRTSSVSKQPNFWPRLNELTMPVLVVAGQRDEKYRNISLRFDDETSANVESKIVPSCGHIVHREQPEAFVEIVRQFANRFAC
jgi:2-succinyl-6-hydroxy-2,4-cyclohexadiene-1-carboxylate synthase